jgi:capsular polysaccharide biosynthesis protein
MMGHIMYNNFGKTDILNNIIESPSHFKNNKTNVFYHEEGISPGYVEGEDGLSLISDTIKIIGNIPRNNYHFLIEFVGQVSLMIDSLSDKKIEFILDISTLFPQEREYFCSLVTKLFQSKDATYRYVDSKEFNYININNFILLTNTLVSFVNLISAAAKTFENFFSLSDTINPSKKVYLSRKESALSGDPVTTSRIDNELVIEKIFLDKGFEIVYAENFRTIEEKALFFRDVKVLVGLTGAGLANIIFMKPGQTVIEIVTPQLIPYDGGKVYSAEIHNLYRTICFNRDHILVNIQNQHRIADSITTVLNSIMF